jgi:hypothetical protein
LGATSNEHHDLISKVAPATDARMAKACARAFDPVGVPCSKYSLWE